MVPFNPNTYFEILPFGENQPVVGRTAHKSFQIAGGRTAEVFRLAKPAGLTEGSLLSGLQRFESGRAMNAANVSAPVTMKSADGNAAEIEISGFDAAAGDFVIVLIGNAAQAGI